MKMLLSITSLFMDMHAVADLGFSPGGGAPTPKVGVLIYYFCRKLHENERIWTPRGGARVPGAPPWIRQWHVTGVFLA